MIPDVFTSVVSLSRSKRWNSSGVRNIKSPSLPLYLVSQRKQYILFKKEPNRQILFSSRIQLFPLERQTFSPTSGSCVPLLCVVVDGGLVSSLSVSLTAAAGWGSLQRSIQLTGAQGGKKVALSSSQGVASHQCLPLSRNQICSI